VGKWLTTNFGGHAWSRRAQSLFRLDLAVVHLFRRTPNTPSIKTPI